MCVSFHNYYWLFDCFHVTLLIFGQFSVLDLGWEAQPQLQLFAIWLYEVLSKTVTTTLGNAIICRVFLKEVTDISSELCNSSICEKNFSRNPLFWAALKKKLRISSFFFYNAKEATFQRFSRYLISWWIVTCPLALALQPLVRQALPVRNCAIKSTCDRVTESFTWSYCVTYCVGLFRLNPQVTQVFWKEQVFKF